MSKTTSKTMTEIGELQVIATFAGKREQDIFSFDIMQDDMANQAYVLKVIFDVLGEENIKHLIKLSLWLAGEFAPPAWLLETQGKVYFETKDFQR